MQVIKVIEAEKKYGLKADSLVVLQKYSMSVSEGSIYSLMGASGCGKTTLIACLVGILKLDNGDIRIFDEPPKNHRQRIGYMPQETALVNEFTVREMISFYGKIYGLSSDKIDERFRFLSDLLELPPEDRLIVDCSGGEQRRISFALTLVHEPEMLILDEPTVGVDPLLRAKIWDYLVDLTKTKNVTVLLSTHYIEEAKQSTHVGLMRNGVQLAEESPQNIIRALQTINLEQAFLILAQKQELRMINGVDVNTNVNQRDAFNENDSANSSCSLTSFGKKILVPQTSKNFLKALINKNFLQLYRNVVFTTLILVLPIVCCFGMHYGVGSRIKDLKLGIVNDEVDYKEQCANRSLVTTELVGDRCTLKKASCRFIDDLEDDVIEKIFYESRDEAYDAGKRGNIVGYIYFASNYTESMVDFSDEGSIQVQLDQTDLQKMTSVQGQLYDTYSKFIGKLLRECGRSDKAGGSPLVVEAAHGKLSFEMKTSLIPGFILSGFFIISSYFLAISVLTDRNSGSWDRMIVAGVKPENFLISHLVEGVVLTAIDFTMFAGYVVVFLAPNLSSSSTILMFTLMILVGLLGVVFGLLLSIVLKSVKTSLLAIIFIAFPATFTSGIIWPIEGMPLLMQQISYIFPFSFPVTASRIIIVKASTLFNPTVYMAFLTLTGWITALLLCCFWLIRSS